MGYSIIPQKTNKRNPVVEGRIQVASAAFAVVCVSVFTIIEYNLTIGQKNLPAQIMRLCLTIWLCHAVYRGSRVAKWIAIVLCTIGVCGFLYFLLTLGGLPMLTRVSFVANIASYAYFIYVVSLSPDGRAYLEAVRSE